MSEKQIAAVRERSGRFVYIPQFSGATASLNVCVAGAIVLHHFAVGAGLAEQGREGGKFLVDQGRSKMDRWLNPTEEERGEIESKRMARMKAEGSDVLSE